MKIFMLIYLRCVQSGVLNAQTSIMVRAKSCLAASLQEMVARKAARDLFARYIIF